MSQPEEAKHSLLLAETGFGNFSESGEGAPNISGCHSNDMTQVGWRNIACQHTLLCSRVRVEGWEASRLSLHTLFSFLLSYMDLPYVDIFGRTISNELHPFVSWTKIEMYTCHGNYFKHLRFSQVT